MAINIQRIYKIQWESGVPYNWKFPHLFILAHHYRKMKSVSVLPIDADGKPLGPLVTMLVEHVNQYYKMEPKGRSSKILKPDEIQALVWPDGEPQQAGLFEEETDG